MYCKMHPHTQAQSGHTSAHAPVSSSHYDGAEMSVVSLEGHTLTHTQNPMIRGDSRTSYSTSNNNSNSKGKGTGKSNRVVTDGRRSNTSASDRDHSIEEGSAVCVGSHGTHTGSGGVEGAKVGRAEVSDEARYSASFSPPTLTVRQQLEEIWQTVQLRAVWRPMVSTRNTKCVY